MLGRYNISFSIIILLVLVFISASFVQTFAASEQYDLILGTSVVGGTYLVYGGGWAKIMEEQLDGVNITVQEGGGPSTNIQLIQQGRMDLGLATVNVAYQGWHGIDWADGQKYDRMRSIFPMYASYLHLLTLERNPIHTIHDFEGKHIAVGTPGNTSNIAGIAVMEVLGIEPSKLSLLSSQARVSNLKDNILDAYVDVTGLPGPSTLDLQSTHDIRVIGLSEEDMGKILEKFPYFFDGKIPEGTYEGMDEDVTTISFWNIAIADKNLPDDLVYNLVKETFENKDKMLNVDPTAKQLSPENVKYSIIPLHPGAYRYYQEIGVEIPESIIPKD